jgi:catechol 2,3-dioxygenase-like lactoylglutathione lyase family enzyme
MELITYQGLEGRDRFPLSKPPATGILHCGFAVESVPDTVQRARDAGINVDEFENIETIFASGRMAALHSPSGLRIELYQSG